MTTSNRTQKFMGMLSVRISCHQVDADLLIMVCSSIVGKTAVILHTDSHVCRCCFTAADATIHAQVGATFVPELNFHS